MSKGTRDVLLGTRNLESRRWDGLTEDKRLQTFQDTENKIAKAQGRPAARVEFQSMPQKSCGYYRSSENKIVINSNRLADRNDSVRTLVHEGRHAYQHHAAGKPELDPRSHEWKENFKPENYVPASKNYLRYKNQPVEKDAWQFEDQVSRDFERKRR